MTAQFQYTTGVGVAGGALVDGVKGALLKGWTVTSQLTAGSGLPFTPVYLAPVPGTGVTGSLRPSLTGATATAPDGYYLNPDAYAPPAAGQWGTAGRNSAIGPDAVQPQRRRRAHVSVDRASELRLAARLHQRAEPRDLHGREHHHRRPAVRAAEPREYAAESPKHDEAEILMTTTELLNHEAHQGHEGFQKLLCDLRDLCGSVICRVAVVVLAAGAVVVAQQPAQQPPAATFRSTTRLIVQTVSVKDKDGKPIEGLTAKDFIVTEDGEPQTVSFAEFQRLPTIQVTASGQVTIGDGTPDVATPVAPRARPRPRTASRPRRTRASHRRAPGDIRYRNRRLLVLYFDLTALPPPDLLRAYNAARKYINTQMTPADLVAVMGFQGGGVRVKQDFTDNKDELLEVVQTLVFGEDKDGDGIPDTLEEGTAFGQDDAEFAILNTDRQLSALQTAVGMLRPLPDQKSLVYFSSGLRLNGVDNQAQLRATTNAAIRANVSIFPVDARGLVASAPLGDATQAVAGGRRRCSPARRRARLLANFQRSQDTLYSLAKDTGGKAMFDYNDLSMGIVQAAQAVTSYYILGFYSSHTALDGKFHRVKISLAGDLSADARRTGRATSPTRSSRSSPTPTRSASSKTR